MLRWFFSVSPIICWGVCGLFLGHVMSVGKRHIINHYVNGVTGYLNVKASSILDELNTCVGMLWIFISGTPVLWLWHTWVTALKLVFLGCHADLVIHRGVYEYLQHCSEYWFGCSGYLWRYSHYVSVCFRHPHWVRRCFQISSHQMWQLSCFTHIIITSDDDLCL